MVGLRYCWSKNFGDTHHIFNLDLDPFKVDDDVDSLDGDGTLWGGARQDKPLGEVRGIWEAAAEKKRVEAAGRRIRHETSMAASKERRCNDHFRGDCIVLKCYHWVKTIRSKKIRHETRMGASKESHVRRWMHSIEMGARQQNMLLLLGENNQVKED